MLGISKLSNGQENKEKLSFYSLADFGAGSVDEDAFVLVLLEQGLRWDGLEVRLSGPLRLRVLDRSPRDDGILRGQDWDEPSDYMRVLRSISYVHRWQDADLSVHIGELAGVGLGHGSLVDFYFNTTDMDTYQAGMIAKGSWLGNGVELLIENLVKPEIIAGRAFMAPLAWFFDTDWAGRLEIGGSVGADIAAPFRLGDEEQTVFVVAGGDVSFRAVDEPWLVVMPYADFMAMDGSLGVHIGVAADWDILDKREFKLNIRAEYRYVGSDYHPAVFNPFYDSNRFYYPVENSTDPETFADHLADGSDLPSRHGVMLDAMFEWTGGLRVGLRYDTEGRNRRHFAVFRVEAFPWEGYNFAAFFGGQDIRGGQDIVSLDSLFGLSARGRIWGPFNLFADFTRRWRGIGKKVQMANEIAGGIGVLIVY